MRLFGLMMAPIACLASYIEWYILIFDHVPEGIVNKSNNNQTRLDVLNLSPHCEHK